MLSTALREMVTRMQRNSSSWRARTRSFGAATSCSSSCPSPTASRALHKPSYFQDRLRVEVRRADRTGEQLALLLVDIDDFKR